MEIFSGYNLAIGNLVFKDESDIKQDNLQFSSGIKPHVPIHPHLFTEFACRDSLNCDVWALSASSVGYGD